MQIVALLVVAFTCHVSLATRYTPDWKSLDARPLPEWYDEAKVGVFLHWGVYSVPALINEWFMEALHDGNPEAVAYMKANYKPDFTYADFAPSFTAHMFNPDYWASLFADAGAKYVVLTSKHHEGFCNFKTDNSYNWNSLDVGPKRDLVGDLATAVRKKGFSKFGVYHSWFDFYNPLFLADQASGFKTQRFVFTKPTPCLHELVNQYHPDLIWSDGDWMANSDYWNATTFLAWLYNDSPVKDFIVVNDRWGADARCHHGGFLNCDDKYNPGKLLTRKWENALAIDKYSWGYRRTLKSYEVMTINEILTSLVSTVSCGGNFLLNTGPRSDGTFDPLMEERLRQMGAWLKINGEAIYASKPWKFQNDTKTPNIWYTAQPAKNAVYATVLKWPAQSILFLKAPNVTAGKTTVEMLGFASQLKFQGEVGGGVTIQLPTEALLSLPNAWVLKFTNLANATQDSSLLLYKELEMSISDGIDDLH